MAKLTPLIPPVTLRRKGKTDGMYPTRAGANYTSVVAAWSAAAGGKRRGSAASIVPKTLPTTGSGALILSAASALANYISCKGGLGTVEACPAGQLFNPPASACQVGCSRGFVVVFGGEGESMEPVLAGRCGRCARGLFGGAAWQSVLCASKHRRWKCGSEGQLLDPQLRGVRDLRPLAWGGAGRRNPPYGPCRKRACLRRHMHNGHCRL